MYRVEALPSLRVEAVLAPRCCLWISFSSHSVVSSGDPFRTTSIAKKMRKKQPLRHRRTASITQIFHLRDTRSSGKAANSKGFTAALHIYICCRGFCQRAHCIFLVELCFGKLPLFFATSDANVIRTRVSCGAPKRKTHSDLVFGCHVHVGQDYPPER